MIFYFSGTGNSRWVAERLGELLGESVYSIADMFVGRILLPQVRTDWALSFPFIPGALLLLFLNL